MSSTYATAGHREDAIRSDARERQPHRQREHHARHRHHRGHPHAADKERPGPGDESGIKGTRRGRRSGLLIAAFAEPFRVDLSVFPAVLNVPERGIHRPPQVVAVFGQDDAESLVGVFSADRFQLRKRTLDHVAQHGNVIITAITRTDS
jgi:hypothetical protein